MPRYMDQCTLLDGLQTPIVNAGAEVSRGVLQINAWDGWTQHVR